MSDKELMDPFYGLYTKEDDIISHYLNLPNTVIKTGIEALDDLLGFSLREGTLAFVTGESGVGITSFMNQISDYIAKTRPVIFVYLEDRGSFLEEKSIVNLSHTLALNEPDKYEAVSVDDIKSGLGQSPKKDLTIQKAINHLKYLKKVVLDNYEPSILLGGGCEVDRPINICEAVETMVKERGEKPVVFIDGSYLLKPDRGFTGDQPKRYIFLKLKQIADKFGAAIIVSVPLSKEACQFLHDHPSVPIDQDWLLYAKEIGSIPSLIMGLRLVERGTRNNPTDWIAIDIAKDRHGELGRSVELIFNRKFMTFKR